MMVRERMTLADRALAEGHTLAPPVGRLPLRCTRCKATTSAALRRICLKPWVFGDRTRRNAPEGYVTTRIAAERLLVTPQRVQQLIACGDLSAVKNGMKNGASAWLIRETSLDALIRRRNS